MGTRVLIRFDNKTNYTYNDNELSITHLSKLFHLGLGVATAVRNKNKLKALDVDNNRC